MKLLLWAAIGLVVVMWLVRGKKGKPDAGISGAPKPDVQQEPEPMIQCAHCGVHLPASEAVSDPSGAAFCSDEHRLRHAGSR